MNAPTKAVGRAKVPRRAPVRRSKLEREVLIAVIALYLLICAALLAVHYLQPDGQSTTTSSPSPTHEGFSNSGETQ